MTQCQKYWSVNTGSARIQQQLEQSPPMHDTDPMSVRRRVMISAYAGSDVRILWMAERSCSNSWPCSGVCILTRESRCQRSYFSPSVVETLPRNFAFLTNILVFSAQSRKPYSLHTDKTISMDFTRLLSLATYKKKGWSCRNRAMKHFWKAC